MIELASRSTDVLSARNNDFLVNSSSQKPATVITRTKFDPSNEDHLRSFRNFIDTGTWGKVHFYAEVPYTTVPDTVLWKVALHALSKQGF